MSRRSASLNFEMTYTIRDEFRGYKGCLAGARDGEVYVDTQDEWNLRPHYWVSIRPLCDGGENDTYKLTTQGRLNGGRRYRYGTLADMIEAAEKWAGRRFRIEQKETLS